MNRETNHDTTLPGAECNPRKQDSAPMIDWQLAIKAADKYRIVTDFTYDWEMWIAPDGTTMYVSPSCERITGHTAAEFMADPNLTVKITHPDDLSKVREHLCKAQDQQPIELNFRIIRPDGDIRWIDHLCSVVYSEDGQWVGRRASNRDITGRKQAEEALCRKEFELQNVLDATADGILAVDCDGKVITMNNRFLEQWHIPRTLADSGDNQTLLNYVLDQLSEPDTFLKKVAMLYDSPQKEMDTLEFKDGRVYERYSAPLIQENALIGRVWSFRDITKSKQAAEALEKSKWRLENIIEATHVGTWEWNVQTGETVFNEAWARIIGYTLDELAPVNIKTWERLVHPDDLKQSASLLERHFAGELPYYDYECRMKHKNGHWVWINDRGRVITSTADGKPLLMFGTHTELMKSNAYLENLISCAHAPIMVWDANFHITRFNHAFELLTGRLEAEVLGQAAEMLFPPALAHKSMALIRQASAGECWKAVEIEIMHLDGTIRTVLWNSATLFAPDSRTPIATIAQGQDITESKLAEEAIRQNQARFEQLAVQSRTIVWEVNADGLYTYISQMAEQLLGYRQAEITGKKHFYDLHPEDRREEFKTAALAVFKRKEPFLNQENKLQTRDGGFIWVSTNGIPILDADGKLLGYRGSDTDITEHRLTEEALQETKDYLDNLFNHANAPIIVWDSKFRITQFNSAFEKLSGRNVSDVLGKTVDILFPAEALEQSIECIKQTTGGECWDAVEIQIRHIDGSIRTLLWNSATMYSADGTTIIGTIAQGYDITERKRMETALIEAKEHAEESDRLKTAFLRNISHEIRTPFNCILGFLSLLDDDTLSAGAKREYTGMINQSAERLMVTINEIVEIAMIQSGLIKLKEEESDVGRLAEELVERFKPQAKIKGLEFTLKNTLTVADSRIAVDIDKLSSVLNILINNAIKFTLSGSIELSLRKNIDCLEFSVKDTGIGVPEDKDQAIFECFMQADVSNTRKFEGVGLGLSIAKAYVEMLGGCIWFESKTGAGSTFYFTIPCPLKDATPKTCSLQELAATKPAVQQSSKILVTEDDEFNFEYINTILTKANYEVLHALTGAEAVEICRKNPDIGSVLMDIKMPVMDGYIATREIRKFNLSVPIIAITAYAESGDRKKCLDAGMNDFASKPVTPQDLKGVLNKWFTRVHIE